MPLTAHPGWYVAKPENTVLVFDRAAGFAWNPANLVLSCIGIQEEHKLSAGAVLLSNCLATLLSTERQHNHTAPLPPIRRHVDLRTKKSYTMFPIPRCF
jgi:hypothetical protein